MAQTADLYRFVRAPLGQQGVQRLAALQAQLLLLEQDIDGKYHRHKDGADRADNTLGGGDGGAEHIAEAAAHKVHHAGQQGLPVHGQSLQPAVNFGVGHELLLRPDGEPPPGGYNGGPQAGYTLCQLGHNDQQQRRNDHRHHNDGRQQAENAGSLRRQAPPSPAAGGGAKELFFKERHGHIQHKGHRAADQQRGGHAAHKPKKRQDLAEVLQARKQQYGKGDEKHQLPHGCAGNFHACPS